MRLDRQEKLEKLVSWKSKEENSRRMEILTSHTAQIWIKVRTKGPHRIWMQGGHCGFQQGQNPWSSEIGIQVRLLLLFRYLIICFTQVILSQFVKPLSLEVQTVFFRKHSHLLSQCIDRDGKLIIQIFSGLKEEKNCQSENNSFITTQY